MKYTTLPAGVEESMALRAVWLHYAGGLTQAEIARRFAVPAVKVHRWIARAVADGVVKVSVEGEIIECVALETEIVQRYGLDFCEVAPDLAEDGLPLRALGVAGASFLQRIIEQAGDQVIGLGFGRTLAAAVDQLRSFAAPPGLRFVSLLGGVTRNFAANPHDVMQRIAEKTGAPAFVMPVPFFANSIEDREVLLSQRGVSDVYAMSCRAPLKIAGIGTVEEGAVLLSSGMIEAGELAAVADAGGVGEMLGTFYDAGGRVLDTELTGRTIAARGDTGDGATVIAIAGGPGKIGAIRAVLASGGLKGLITDEATARRILATLPGS